MKLHNLVHSTAWSAVFEAMQRLYPKIAKDAEEAREAYWEVFLSLLTQSPASIDGLVLTIDLAEKPEPDEPPWYDVGADRPGDETGYALEYTPWAEWLDLEVTEELRERCTDAEIIAHCLHEMTFCGGDEETIQAEANRLRDLVKRIQDGTAELVRGPDVEAALEALGADEGKPSDTERSWSRPKETRLAESMDYRSTGGKERSRSGTRQSAVDEEKSK